MSERVYSWLDRNSFELGDIVEFDGPSNGDVLSGKPRLRGEVVRVYNSRTAYHVEVNGERYFVTPDDNMVLKP